MVAVDQAISATASKKRFIYSPSVILSEAKDLALATSYLPAM
jgi:hypothetical protein